MISSSMRQVCRILPAFALMLLIVAVVGCSRDGDTGQNAALPSPGTAELQGKLVLTGSSTVAPMVSEMAKVYMSKHPGVQIDVQTGGSSRGVRDARSGTADIGMVSRALKTDETDLTATLIAMDGLCLIVHADNPIASLTDDQVRAIWQNQVNNWSDVGGPAGPITVVHKAEGRSTLELFLHYYELKNSACKPDVVIGDNEQGIKQVAGNPAAIGYVSIGAAEYSAEAGVPIRLLPMAGMSPTTSAVASGNYSLSRPLNLVTKGEAGLLAQSFIDYCRSAEAAPLVKDLYFVPITP